MKSPTLPIALALSLCAAGALAQTVAETLEFTRERVEKQKRFIVAGSLPLTAEEEKAFWPLFDQHEEAQRKIHAREDRLVVEYVAQYEQLSDDRARAMLDEMVRLDEDEAKLRRTFVEKMARALPPRKLARYFQIDNRLEAIVRAELTQRIPLVP